MALDLERELLFQAMAAPIGIVIQTEELDLDLVRLGKARAAEPETRAIEIRRSPASPQTELWLVRVEKIPKAPATPAPMEAAPPPAIEIISLGDLGL